MSFCHSERSEESLFFVILASDEGARPESPIAIILRRRDSGVVAYAPPQNDGLIDLKYVILILSMEEQPEVNNQIQQPPVNPNPVSKKPNQWLIAAIILVVIVFIGSIYILSVQSQKKISPPSPEPPLPPKITSQPSPIQYDTGNWKTYRNEVFIYSVQYPFDWKITEAKPKSEYETETLIKEENEIQKVTFSEKNPKLYQGHFQIRVLSNSNNTTLEQWVKNYKIPLLADPSTNLAKVIGNTTLNGRPAIEISINTLTVPNETAIVTMNNNYIYYVRFDNWSNIEADEITQYGAERLIQINDQILSTFKFTDQEDHVVCTQDVRQCPDGKTYVGREGPNCEFAPCP